MTYRDMAKDAGASSEDEIAQMAAMIEADHRRDFEQAEAEKLWELQMYQEEQDAQMSEQAIQEYRKSIDDCCGEEAGERFCESWGCGSVLELLEALQACQQELRETDEEFDRQNDTLGETIIELAACQQGEDRLREEMVTLADIMYDCDGYRTPSGLMNLIGELRSRVLAALEEQENPGA